MNTVKTSSFGSLLGAFHNDEDGLEAVQVVMILGIATVVLLVGWQFWGKISTWVNGAISRLTGTIKE